MFFDTLEDKIKQNERTLNELKLRYEQLNKEIEQLFKEFDVSQEDICKYASDPNNFSPKDWNELEKRRKTLDERLENDLKSIRDVSKAKKSFEERNVSNHWIFCK